MGRSGMRSTLCGVAMAGLPTSMHEVPATWSARVVLNSAHDAAMLARVAGHYGLAAGSESGDRHEVAVVELGAHALTALRNAGVAVEVDEMETARIARFQAQQGPSHASPSTPSRSQRSAVPNAFHSVSACYRGVSRIQTDMEELERHYPQLARVTLVGQTWSQRQATTLRDLATRVLPARWAAALPDRFGRGRRYGIVALVLGNRMALRRRAMPRMVITAGLHARELASSEAAMRFAEWLVRGYGQDATATWLLDHNEFHFVVHANPDGRAMAEQGVLARGGGWRKNLNVVDGHCSTSPVDSGVDLNRNFVHGWGGNSPHASSNDPCDETYRGPAPLSEPESQALTQYIAGIRGDDGEYHGGVLRDLRAERNDGDGSNVMRADYPGPADYPGLYVDLHSFGGWILWPDGGGGVSALAQRMAWHTRYRATQRLHYPVEGESTAMFRAALGVPALVVELAKSFYEPCYEFQRTTLPPALDALRYAARTLRAPRMLARGPDVTSVRLSAARVRQGEVVTIAATLDGDRYRYDRGLRGQPAVPRNLPRRVLTAHASVRVMPDDASVRPIALRVIERRGAAAEVSGTLDTTHLPAGRHLVFVQGVGWGGVRGAPDAVFLDIAP
ncbi:hypothetical protein LMG32289_00169 [Cupriavidus pampae]|uniref:Peptidase M14 domain-containing protein n=2 Tax=Cupriavidus pampae TaxID=659251 RepID=A0ABN7XVN2_9BURK|nr:hypothetical protein LMG32289_00169 [Cupriavidus pampae]